jgi:hypothetical protein
MSNPHPHLVVIGGGNMGKAIVVGCVNAGILSPQRVCVADPAAEKRARFGALGVHVVATAWDALAWLAPPPAPPTVNCCSPSNPNPSPPVRTR